MGSRERELTTAAPPSHHLSSLVVRPDESGGGGGGGSDYEPGEVRREPPPPSYSRGGAPDRFHHEASGNGTRASSGSPLSRRKFDYHPRADYDSSGPMPIGRGFRGGRGPGRFRDSSPPYGRGRVGGARFSGRDFDGPRRDFDGPRRDFDDPRRDFDGPRFGSGPFRGVEGGVLRNNPNVPPREGDWICPDPSCGNLNFARREYCNKCNRLRIGPRDGSPRRNYQGPPRFSGLPVDGSPVRGGPNGFNRSPPPRSWGRDGPKEFGAGPPPTRHAGGRFPDNHVRRERPDYRDEDDFRDRGKFDRPMPPDWNHRDRGRDTFFKERRGGLNMRNERRPLSPPPPPPPHRARFGRDIRERSRSPLRNGAPTDYRRDSYVGRGGRDARVGGMARGQVGDHPY
ncbi:hypothetical protein MKW98_011898 [Papaver atlanticum]|uniref:RanBP2-type domain-containing protein n=1 Tax=Papaver atlanticum TaxID=357466 RepID=A0AAD4XRW3_9MAGN|nr:hypothetical protein MKW98_011898 [Papaver atlanticum]